MGKTVVIILGSGLYDLYGADFAEEVTVRTKFGTVQMSKLSQDAFPSEARVLVMLRHGKNHSIPPHLINYRANVSAAKQARADYIIATASVGSVKPRIPIGSYVAIDQFLDFTKSRAFSFFLEQDEKFVHTDMTHPYSDEVRRALIHGCKTSRVKSLFRRGTYVCTEGPRFETPAEIKMFRKMGGDVVGMTGVPEVVLANEIGISYGTLANVTNLAAGMQTRITQEEVNLMMKKSLGQMKSILKSAVGELCK